MDIFAAPASVALEAVAFVDPMQEEVVVLLAHDPVPC